MPNPTCYYTTAFVIRYYDALDYCKELKYDEEFQVCEDYDLGYRISRTGKILNLPGI